MPHLTPDPWFPTVLSAWMSLHSMTNLIKKVTFLPLPTTDNIKPNKTNPWIWPW
uniref:ATPase subunit 8 n=1 Tax=Kinyongia fischeri TaxID=414978 RepID=D6RS13_KINFI|nr:ATPase subunit 8 [Kinyongia fischeri]